VIFFLLALCTRDTQNRMSLILQLYTRTRTLRTVAGKRFFLRHLIGKYILPSLSHWPIALEGLSPLSLQLMAGIGVVVRGSVRLGPPPHILPSLSHWSIALERLSPLQGYVAGVAYNAGVKSGGRAAPSGASRLVAGGCPLRSK
jgi:hypothetical protein